MKLTPSEAHLIRIALQSRITTQEIEIAKWDALPDDTIVDNFTRYVIQIYKEDLPKNKALLERMKAQ